MKKQRENAEDDYVELSPEKAIFRECGIEPPVDCERYFKKIDRLSE